MRKTQESNILVEKLTSQPEFINSFKKELTQIIQEVGLQTNLTCI